MRKESYLELSLKKQYEESNWFKHTGYTFEQAKQWYSEMHGYKSFAEVEERIKEFRSFYRD